MIKRLLVICFGIGWAFAGFRNLPRLPQPYAAAAGVIVASSLALAYWAGTRRRRDSAVAAAVAKAEAHAAAVANVASSARSDVTTNVIVVDPERGAQRAGASLGLADAPWLVGRHRTIELDETEALDAALEDALDAREAEA